MFLRGTVVIEIIGGKRERLGEERSWKNFGAFFARGARIKAERDSVIWIDRPGGEDTEG